jgi:hypothetical protein
MLTTIAVLVFLILTIFIILFQIALVIGKPWGEYTMGGYVKGILPLKLRITAFVSALILTLIGFIGLEKSGIVNLPFSLPNYLIWFVVGYMFLGSILNSITKSKKERMIWRPVTIVLFLCSLYLALG